MNDKNFFFKSILIPIFVCFLFFGINFYLDVYGIFGWEAKSKKVVYGEERIAKYLKAHRYIPNNFDGLLLGPSLSANIDPKGLSTVNVYNASVIGGHVTSMHTLYEKAKSRGGDFKTVIVCINPYVTSNYEGENLNMKPEDYWSAWGSYNLLKYYMLMIIRQLDLLPNKFPRNQYTPNGTNYFEYRFKVPNVEEKILEYTESISEDDFKIDKVAKKELKELAELLASDNAEILIYHHPLPNNVYQKHKDNFDEYWVQINSIMNSDQNGFTVIDFNHSEFLLFTSDSKNYMDHWHLSTKGQMKFVELLDSYFISNAFNSF